MISDLRIDEERKRMYYEKGYWGTSTLSDIWSSQSKKYAQHVYVKDTEGHSYTYGEIDQAAARVATWMKEVGVENGDIVTFQLPKWAEFAIIYVACLKVGAVMHPYAVRNTDQDLIETVNSVGTAVYIAPTFYHNRNYEMEYRAICGSMPNLKGALFVDRIASTIPGEVSLSCVLTNCEPLDEPSPSKSDEAACILSTSGSTGRPKQAVFTHNTILFSERAYIAPMGFTEDDIVWMPSPLNHATGFYHGLIATMLFGGCAILQECYSPESAVKLIREEGCTWSHGATPFIYDLLSYLDEHGGSLPSMRFYICGGAPVPSSMIEHASRYGILLSESYGSTESCPHVYVPLDKCLEWNGAWSGIPYEGIEVRVVDANHNEVPRGAQGEEASRGPHQFVGYLNEPERTDRALDSDGWFYSGDLCYMDEEGRIRISGRMKEIIIRGGENISCNEVDQQLDGCPGVGEHATIGAPDKRMGERICTFLVPKPGAKPTVESITEYLAEKGTPKRVWPERIEYIDRIPYTPTGKVQRFKLAAELLLRMREERNER
ncbi:AMP-dependent synthetase [Denitrobacterium detoxificans]|uniref:Acyl-CoA synthetase n=2 Tax=Denitrobacterium detoxificans TaxID=79604 RepID=A0A172RXS6_9ACTN|nr:medium-chain fatty-acid--CoA ligase [Denitrobacterium detoxificans]ANE22531.1 AMP-dependent synthetase [Denitrobacterium detoxificans]SEO98927.1 acyl-CoA synthetase [Denitrobacterium detoxificans]